MTTQTTSSGVVFFPAPAMSFGRWVIDADDGEYQCGFLQIHAALGQVNHLVSDLQPRVLSRPTSSAVAFDEQVDDRVQTYDRAVQRTDLRAMSRRATVRTITEQAIPEQPEDVVRLLLEHPEILDPLVDAIVTAKQVFGAGTELKLRLVSDPDSDYREVFLVACTDRDPDSALNLLEQLDRDWLLKQPSSVRNLLNVTIGSR